MKPYQQKEIEKSVLEYWRKNQIPEELVKLEPKKKKFYLLDGPPYVNGIPHVGHVKTTTFKDIWGRFKKMQGFSVWFQPGFDCSGLPIENAVEKKLGIKSKKEIEEKIGISKFIKECKNFAEQNLHVWMGLYKKLGALRGWMEPYLTYKNYYLESGWWTIKKMYEQGLLVEGYKPGFWCPKCETVLSGYEVTDSYKNLEDPSIYVKFPVKNRKEYLLVWTTTPWTLPANVAVCVHPEETYVKVKTQNDVLILAEKRLDVLHSLEIGYTIIEKFPGKKLEGTKYEPVLDVPVQKELEKVENTHQVILSVPVMKKRVASKTIAKRDVKEKEEVEHIVDMSTGSGLVHIAPGHGDVDNKLGKHYNLPEPSPVNEQGRLTKEAGKFAGIYVKKADPLIIEELKNKNYLLHAEKIIHSYPLCWRCKSPLIYRMSKQLFLKLDKIRGGVIKENKTVNWLPGFARERFHNLVSDAPDWAITRQRYWGITVPLWVCKKCGAKKIIGSRKELKELVSDIPDDMDLHKDSVDNIVFKCSKCGGEMKRIKDIMDVWFDSGISPWASLGYPFSNRELFERLWPVDLVDESQDQIRGWFYTLMVCGYSVFKRKPYETVCLNGWTLDEKGEKMSKSVGNVILAEDAYNELGADLLRLYYCVDNAPWETQKFSMRMAKDLRRVLSVLWNSYVFIDTYSDRSLAEKKKMDYIEIEDEWIISRINSIIKDVTNYMETFHFHHAARTLVEFILNDFSRWYIKIIRDRVSPWYEGKDKEAAQFTLLYVLKRVLKLLAPFTPFITEKIYTDVFQEKSVHLSSWPEPEDVIDKELEEYMNIIKDFVEKINSIRQEKGIKLKWPLKQVTIYPKNEKVKKAVKVLEGILKETGNAKTVKISEKPVKGKETDFGSVSVGDIDKDESFIREFIRFVQVLRKKEKLKVTEKIRLYVECDENTETLLKRFDTNILKNTGSSELIFEIKHQKSVMEFEDKKVKIGFEKYDKTRGFA